MVTEYTYTIPCSCCTKSIIVTGKRFCSGACKVKAFRDKEIRTQEIDIESEPVTTELHYTKHVTSKLHKTHTSASTMTELPLSKHRQASNALHTA